MAFLLSGILLGFCAVPMLATTLWPAVARNSSTATRRPAAENSVANELSSPRELPDSVLESVHRAPSGRFLFNVTTPEGTTQILLERIEDVASIASADRGRSTDFPSGQDAWNEGMLALAGLTFVTISVMWRRIKQPVPHGRPVRVQAPPRLTEEVESGVVTEVMTARTGG